MGRDHTDVLFCSPSLCDARLSELRAVKARTVMTEARLVTCSPEGSLHELLFS